MFNRGRLWIIPNDDIIQPLYFSEVNNGTSHLESLQDFADKFKLDIKFSKDDYQEAPIDIAGCGHLVIKSDDDSKMLIFYVPRHVTDRQLEFFQNNEMFFSNEYSIIGGYSLEDSSIKSIHGVIEIRKELFIKNKQVKKHI